jgi:flagellar hook-basal body complex protein FliE
MSLTSVAMQQALEQLREMRESVRPPSVASIDIAQQQGGAERPASISKSSFVDTLKAAVDSVNSQQAVSRELQTAYIRGEDVPLTDVAIAMQKSSVAFEATVQVRNKIVEAYKEIMNMTV